MREDPVFSGGVVKAVLVVLVAGALGVGAYAIVGDGIDVDLPDVDLPEVEDTGTEVVDLAETELSDTTIDGPAIDDPFASATFAAAIAQIGDAAGADAELTRVFINGVQTQAAVRRGDGIEAVSVRADTGELVREEATIEISGDATIDDFAFPLSDVRPDAVDRILAAARKRSGSGEFEPSVLSLERGIPVGNRALEWTISGIGGGRSHSYHADLDGKLSEAGGGSTPVPPEAIEAQRLNQFIQDAANDPERIFDCLERFR
ncbi:MAG: hypothetical protein ACRDKH_02575 [Solirubrobacterales bacterium]